MQEKEKFEVKSKSFPEEKETAEKRKTSEEVGEESLIDELLQLSENYQQQIEALEREQTKEEEKERIKKEKKRFEETFGLEPQNSPLYQECQKIFNRLLKATGLDPEEFELVLIQKQEINAFIFNAQKNKEEVEQKGEKAEIKESKNVFLYNGLIKKFGEVEVFLGRNLTKDEIAFILAHEISHLLQERLPAYKTLIGSQQAEYDADRKALEIMGKAGFNPKAGIKAMEALARLYGSPLSITHPASDHRIKALRSEIYNDDFVLLGITEKEEDFGQDYKKIETHPEFRELYLELNQVESLDKLLERIEKIEDLAQMEEALPYLAQSLRLALARDLSENPRFQFYFKVNLIFKFQEIKRKYKWYQSFLKEEKEKLEKEKDPVEIKRLKKIIQRVEEELENYEIFPSWEAILSPQEMKVWRFLQHSPRNKEKIHLSFLKKELPIWEKPSQDEKLEEILKAMFERRVNIFLLKLEDFYSKLNFSKKKLLAKLNLEEFSKPTKTSIFNPNPEFFDPDLFWGVHKAYYLKKKKQQEEEKEKKSEWELFLEEEIELVKLYDLEEISERNRLLEEALLVKAMDYVNLEGLPDNWKEKLKKTVFKKYQLLLGEFLRKRGIIVDSEVLGLFARAHLADIFPFAWDKECWQKPENLSTQQANNFLKSFISYTPHFGERLPDFLGEYHDFYSHILPFEKKIESVVDRILRKKEDQIDLEILKKLNYKEEKQALEPEIINRENIWQICENIDNYKINPVEFIVNIFADKYPNLELTPEEKREVLFKTYQGSEKLQEKYSRQLLGEKLLELGELKDNYPEQLRIICTLFPKFESLTEPDGQLLQYFIKKLLESAENKEKIKYLSVSLRFLPFTPFSIRREIVITNLYSITYPEFYSSTYENYINLLKKEEPEVSLKDILIENLERGIIFSLNIIYDHLDELTPEDLKELAKRVEILKKDYQREWQKKGLLEEDLDDFIEHIYYLAFSKAIFKTELIFKNWREEIRNVLEIPTRKRKFLDFISHSISYDDFLTYILEGGIVPKYFEDANFPQESLNEFKERLFSIDPKVLYQAIESYLPPGHLKGYLMYFLWKRTGNYEEKLLPSFSGAQLEIEDKINKASEVLTELEVFEEEREERAVKRYKKIYQNRERDHNFVNFENLYVFCELPAKMKVGWYFFEKENHFFLSEKVNRNKKIKRLKEIFPDSHELRDYCLENLLAIEESKIFNTPLRKKIVDLKERFKEELTEEEFAELLFKEYLIFQTEIPEIRVWSKKQKKSYLELLKDFYPLFFNKSKKEIIACQIYELEKELYPEEFLDFDKKLSQIIEMLPEASLARDAILMDFTLNFCFTLEQYQKIEKLFYREEVKKIKKEEIISFFTGEIIKEILTSEDRKKKSEWLLWLTTENSPTPEELQILGGKYKINFDSYQKFFFSISQLERRALLISALQGENGLFETFDKEENEKIFNEFLDKFFEEQFGNLVFDKKDPKKNERGKEILKTIFISLFKFYSPERRTALFSSILEAFIKEKRKGKIKLTTGEIIRLLFEQTGVVGIKAGQILSEQEGLLPKEIRTALRELQDKARPFNKSAVFQYLSADKMLTKEKVSKVGKSLGSASIRQVHKIIYKNKEAVGKFKRPSIDKNFYEDIEVLEKLIKKLQQENIAVPSYLLEEIVQACEIEMDFLADALKQKRARKNISSRTQRIRVPKIYQVERNYILEEFVRGISLKDIIKYQDPSIPEQEKKEIEERIRELYPKKALQLLKKIKKFNIKKIKETLGQEFFVQILKDNFFHADLHYGNIFIDLETEEIYLIDWGSAGEIEPKEKSLYEALLLGFLLKDPKKITESLSFFLEGLTPEKESKLQKIVSDTFSKKRDPSKIATRLLYELLENNFQPKYNFKMFLKAVATSFPFLKEYLSKKRNILQIASLFKEKDKLIRGLIKSTLKKVKKKSLHF